MSAKPKVAFFDFAGCEGDQLEIINLEDRLLDLVEVVDIVSFREAMSEHSDDYEIAFVEGSITTQHDLERLEKVRSNADILIAIGACATIAGVNAIRNDQDFEKVKERVYGEDAELFDDPDAELFEAFEKAYPAQAFVDVEYQVPGCPIDGDEFIQMITLLLEGGDPSLPNHAVCVDCKIEENTCTFERGETCLGPITRGGGCDATCVTQGARCWGCRGMVDNPDDDVYEEVLQEYDVTTEQLVNEFTLYWSWERNPEYPAEPPEVQQ
ncbi:coenzyme F420-reducing hydrogenase, gamma subunit [Halalkaliarchaeum desulfuricum]|uniref:Coenzyme F420-reducing hydrogenase, gamma subunit n=1 Tax=Halalkaliarchaeum desulfuricum TaxID=2055893 RepID=A0A343TLS0_9EURY|nr:NADH:ubiquinone oxidoreductase [Halalkaliarchaeum desulfuricum]AUX10042.1 coenzyme F420-reducing hydrogenase, gamma subunit [Halalkaliarchaeum desulfuricum]